MCSRLIHPLYLEQVIKGTSTKIIKDIYYGFRIICLDYISYVRTTVKLALCDFRATHTIRQA
jgi:hypothetical protein